MTKNVFIAGLVVMVVWFGSAIVRLENYHYASMLGMCGNAEPVGLRIVEREDCLMSTQMRTSPLWHLLYGLQII